MLTINQYLLENRSARADSCSPWPSPSLHAHVHLLPRPSTLASFCRAAILSRKQPSRDTSMGRYQFSTNIKSKVSLYSILHATHVDWQADPRPIRGPSAAVRGSPAPHPRPLEAAACATEWPRTRRGIRGFGPADSSFLNRGISGSLFCGTDRHICVHNLFAHLGVCGLLGAPGAMMEESLDEWKESTN